MQQSGLKQTSVPYSALGIPVAASYLEEIFDLLSTLEFVHLDSPKSKEKP